jgi:glycosyltransferase involved in cell wall biosynthesis
MRLGINGWRLHGQRTGIGRYLYNVIKNWTPEAVVGRFDEINFYTPKPLDRHDTPLPENIRERVLSSDRPMLVWENTQMASVADDDVIFCPSYTRPLFARGKTVVVTHDATQKMYPELFSTSVRLFYTPLYGWSARHATRVITTTEAGRQDIARVWGVPLSKIGVTRLASAEVFRPLRGDPTVDEMRKLHTGGAPFFFFVGKLSGRRNVPRLLESFAAFKRQTLHPHKLVVVGPDNATLNITAIGAQLGLTDHLVRLKYATDEDLNLLYNAAEAFIMPSTYETLSFPVMEAQATGTPVICIDTPGARENTGGAALLIPRLEVPDLVKAMSHLATDAALRRELSETGLANAQSLSWQRCSAETLAVLEEAAQLPATANYLRASEVKVDD